MQHQLDMLASVCADETPVIHASSLIAKGDKWDQVWQTLKEDEELNFRDATRNTCLSELIESSVQAIYAALLDGWTMMLGYSSGKDSETVLHLFLMALVRAVRNGERISQHHFILHTDTGIENPEVRWLADVKLEALERFIKKEAIPLNIVIANPGITQSWTGRVLTGRGLPTFSNSSARQCSQELKITSARRAKAAYVKDLPKEVQNKVCLMLGSRDSESSTRAANIAKFGGSAAKVVNTKHGGELYVIKHWLMSDVWDFLLSSGADAKYPLPSYLASNNTTAQLYKEATGECVIGAAEKRKSEACGARFGCWACQAVGLDKSMQNMLSSDEDKFGYMAGLNRIQRYLAKRRYAWEDRHPIGRTIYEGGYIKLQPDVYSPKFLERLLHVCVSMDYVEAKRAMEVAEKLNLGLIEDTVWNRRMAEPQFRIVSESAICHIDFMWSYHHFNDKPFHALEIYHRVWTMGELDLLEDEVHQQEVPRTPIPKPLWVKVDRWGDGSLFDGLSDPLAEMTYFDGGDDPRAAKVINTNDGVRRVVSFAEEKEVVVEADAANFILWEEYPRLREKVLSGMYTPGYAAQFYLRFGAISFAKGKGSMYHKMMQRGQTYHQMRLSGYQTMEGVSSRPDLKVLTDKKYKALVARKIKARIAKVRWWLNLDLTIRVHLVNKTFTGQWIEDQLRAEEDAQQRETRNQWYNSLRDQFWLASNAFSMFLEVEKESKSRPEIYRYYQATKSKAIDLVASAHSAIGQEWLSEIMVAIKSEFEAAKQCLEDGSSLTFDDYPHWVHQLSKRQPERLLRHISLLMVRMNRVILSGKEQDILKDETQLALPLVA